jgi:hypothetical protein
MRVESLLRLCGAASGVAVILAFAGTGQAEVAVGDVTIVYPDTAEFGMNGQPNVSLKPGTQLYVTEVRGSWVGGTTQIEGKPQLGWLHRNQVRRVAGRKAGAASAIEMATLIGQLIDKQVRVELDGTGFVHMLDASGSKITDSDLAACEQFEHLVAADLSDTKLSDAAIPQLVKSNTLERVYLENVPVTGEALPPIATLKNLEVLVLAGTKIPGAELGALAGLTTLRTLNLAHCPLADDDLRHLRSLVNIEVLVLSDTALTGTGFDQLKPLERLRVLNVCNTAVTDPVLVHLEHAPCLKLFYVRGTQLTTEATNKLRDTLSSCSIYH